MYNGFVCSNADEIIITEFDFVSVLAVVKTVEKNLKILKRFLGNDAAAAVVVVPRNRHLLFHLGFELPSKLPICKTTSPKVSTGLPWLKKLKFSTNLVLIFKIFLFTYLFASQKLELIILFLLIKYREFMEK